MYMLQSLATPELTLRVVVLIWQALLDALCDHTVTATHAGHNNYLILLLIISEASLEALLVIYCNCFVCC